MERINIEEARIRVEFLKNETNEVLYRLLFIPKKPNV